MNPSSNEVVLSDWLDQQRMSRFQWRGIFLCFLVTTFDGFDTQAIAFTGPAIRDSLGISASSLAPVVSAGVAGMAAGALLLGPVGDLLGRRFAVLLATAIFGCFSLATAYAESVTQLMLLRFLTGLGMGGATPNVLALASEYAPARLRGVLMLLATLGLALGAILGSIIAANLLPTLGWRSIYLIGGLAPLACLPPLLRWLPESPYYLVQRGKTTAVQTILRAISPPNCPPQGSRYLLPEKASGIAVAQLFAADIRRNTLAIWLVYFFNWIAWFMLLLWLPAALRDAGLSMEQSALGTAIINGAALLFLIPLAIYLPRIPLKALIIGLLFGGVAVCVGLNLAGGNLAAVYVLVGLSGLTIGGPQLVLNFLAVQIYPTSARATGVGWAIGVGRLGTIVGAYIGGPILDGGGAQGFYLYLINPLLIAALAALLVKQANAQDSTTRNQPA